MLINQQLGKGGIPSQGFCLLYIEMNLLLEHFPADIFNLQPGFLQLFDRLHLIILQREKLLLVRSADRDQYLALSCCLTDANSLDSLALFWSASSSFFLVRSSSLLS